MTDPLQTPSRNHAVHCPPEPAAALIAACDQALPTCLRLAGRYLAVAAGRTPDLGKTVGLDVHSTALNSALTYMDRFVQDFLILTILDHVPSIGFLVEEASDVLRLRQSGDGTETGLPVLTLLIDPIDGTRAFVDGGADFSTLVTLLVDGIPVRVFGLYPAENRLLIGRPLDRTINEPTLRIARDAVDAADPADATWPGRLCCHYRITQPDHGPFAAALQDAGATLCWNGNGFVTNLTGAVQVLEGHAAAFLCPYTAAHDALAPIGLIAAAGGAVRRYAIGPTWSAAQRMPFRFDDLDRSPLRDRGGGSPRLRLIGARSEAMLDRIEAILAAAPCLKGL